MRYHHNELNYQRGLIDDWSLDDVHEIEDISQYEDFEQLEAKSNPARLSVRRRIEEYLDKKQVREQDIEPFDEDYYYDD